MLDINDRKIYAILKIVSDAQEPIDSYVISARLQELDIDMSPRTVRYHLKALDERGLTEVKWREGRIITKKGRDELDNAGVSDKIGLVSSHIEELSYAVDFDLVKRSGRVVINVSLIHKSEFKKAIKIMREVFEKKITMGSKVLIANSGERIGGELVPAGKIGFGTLCAINLNAIYLKHGIPVESRFGGVVQIKDNKPLRFTELVSYAGSTLDPHEIFMRSKMTSVREAAKGEGKILAGLREIPANSKKFAEEIMEECDQAGIGRAIYVGNNGSLVLGMPVGVGRVGVVIPGGLNAVAACEEWGVETESKALSALVDYDRLIDFAQL